jgi:hypothetical protein
MSDRYDWRKDMDSIEACEDVWDCADGCCTNIMPRHNDEAIRLAAYIESLLAERHACPGCNRFATLLVNADACPLQERGDTCRITGGFCADEDTADCVARIVAWKEASDD